MRTVVGVVGWRRLRIIRGLGRILPELGVGPPATTETEWRDVCFLYNNNNNTHELQLTFMQYHLSTTCIGYYNYCGA